MATSVSLQTPTRVRYWVIVFAVALAVVTYIDRVCISQAAPLISRDLAFTKTQMGRVFSAFVFAYAIFEIPSGYLGDRFGAVLAEHGLGYRGFAGVLRVISSRRRPRER